MIRVLAVLLPLLVAPVPYTFTNVRFVSCADVDTCTFDLGAVLPDVLRYIPVRFDGIDGPELHQPKCEQELSLARQGKEYVVEKLTHAGHIDVVNAKRSDKFFRLDAQVVIDGMNLNQDLIAQHFARPYNGKTKRQSWCE